MKITQKILATFTAAALALSLTACSDSPSREVNYSYPTYSYSQTYSSSSSAVSSSSNKYSTPPENYFAQSVAERTQATSEKAAAKKYDFVGFQLNDAVDILKAAGLGNYVDWKSDDGKTIIAKSNWTIKQQQVKGNKVIFICTKTASGISNSIKATAKKAFNYLSSAEGRQELTTLWNSLKAVKGISDTLNEMF